MRPITTLAAACAAALAVAVLSIQGTAAAAPAHAAAAPYYQLVQYPTAGFTGFYAQIAAARHSIDMEMYELSDPVAEQDLVKAAKRGVRVRVLLDRDYSGGEVNASAYTYLQSHGVQVSWAPQHFIFHIKATTFDGRTSDVSTANLTAAYYATTRDAEVIDTNPAQVKAIEHTFNGDWGSGAAGKPRAETVQAPGLIWSPNSSSGSAETAMLSQIRGAKRAIDFESEELSDAPVYKALAAAARRGVDCRIVMTNSREWVRAFRAVTRAGCRVRVFPDSATALYIHEKFVLDDPGSPHESLMIGSQNASWYSLHENRELGLLITNAHGGAAVIQGVAATFQSDFTKASRWR